MLSMQVCRRALGLSVNMLPLTIQLMKTIASDKKIRLSQFILSIFNTLSQYTMMLNISVQTYLIFYPES